MSMYVKKDGVWKVASNSRYVKIAGVWRLAVAGWIKKDGIWKQFLSGSFCSCDIRTCDCQSRTVSLCVAKLPNDTWNCGCKNRYACDLNYAGAGPCYCEGRYYSTCECTARTGGCFCYLRITGNTCDCKYRGTGCYCLARSQSSCESYLCDCYSRDLCDQNLVCTCVSRTFS